MKLDKTKTYGTIHGDTEGRAFEQNGKVFNVKGEEFVAPAVATVAPDTPGTPAMSGMVTGTVTGVVKPVKGDDQVAKQMK